MDLVLMGFHWRTQRALVEFLMAIGDRDVAVCKIGGCVLKVFGEQFLIVMR